MKQWKIEVESKLASMFPVRNEWSPPDALGKGTETRDLFNELVQNLTYGFSSSEYKLN